jgi:hypothetical protein
MGFLWIVEYSLTDLFNTSAAADYLHAVFADKPASYWYQRLINARRTDRPQTYVLPHTTLGKVVLYTPEALDGFIEHEKLRRIGKVPFTGRAAEALHAFGIGKAGGTTHGRIFKGGSANLQAIEGVGAANQVGVQVIINEPLLVFAMTPEQAASFGKELIEAAQAATRINGGK